MAPDDDESAHLRYAIFVTAMNQHKNNVGGKRKDFKRLLQTPVGGVLACWQE